MDLSHLDAGVAFTLGQDYAYYGLPLPDDIDTNFQRGYAIGRTAPQTKELPDRFVRKWLQIRTNAWRRNRAFDASSVTVDFLRRIDRPTCLVSGVTLTHGTGQDTDWSIDRLDNNGAYTFGNLMVLSTRVNFCKGSLSIADISRRANAEADVDGLTAREWIRLARVVACADTSDSISTTELGEWDLREVLRQEEIPHHLFDHLHFMLQHWLVVAGGFKPSRQAAFWQKLASLTPSYAQPDFKRLREVVNAYCLCTYIKRRQACELFAKDEAWIAFLSWFSEVSSRLSYDDLEMLLPSSERVGPAVNHQYVRRLKKEATKGYR